MVCAQLVTDTADMSPGRPVILAVVDLGGLAVLEGPARPQDAHLRVAVDDARPPAESRLLGAAQSADVLVRPGGGVRGCRALLEAYPGCRVAAATTGGCVVLARSTQPLWMTGGPPAPVVASAVYGWALSWWWARRPRPVADLTSRPVLITYRDQRYPTTITHDPAGPPA